MGRPKHKDHRKADEEEDDTNDIINIVAEQLGKAIWEVTEDEIEKYKNENQNEESESEEDEKEDEKERKEEKKSKILGNKNITIINFLPKNSLGHLRNKVNLLQEVNDNIKTFSEGSSKVPNLGNCNFIKNDEEIIKYPNFPFAQFFNQINQEDS